ncbi:MAG: alpha-L-rhamnosidase C-terminal domain-containing protein [Paludibacter sp.]|nr:alpha-L-rhamnosidase C-terminal domain-containing protein [Paludibacter sp.]
MMKRHVLTLATLFSLFALNVYAKITYTNISPVRIVWMSDESGKYVTNPNNLLADFSDQLSVSDDKYTGFMSSDTQQASILLDFGKEIYGGIKISSAIREYKNPVRLRIRFGESVTEAMSDIDILDNPANPTNEHSLRDFVISVPWLGSFQCGNSGFRFVRIDLLDKNLQYNLRNVSATSILRDVQEKGSFFSDNERINKIWETGAYTVKLNMQEYIWDGIKRDRLVWVGDMHPEVMTINSVFGENEVVYKSLDFARKDTPLPGWMNGMCSYSLWWIIIQRDLYMYQGNLDYLKNQREYLLKLVKQIDEKIDKNGVEQLDGTRFLDWPTSENNDVIHSGLQSLSFMAVNAALQIGEYLQDDSIQSIASNCVRRMRNVHIDSFNNSQAAALNILSGLSKNSKQDCNIILKNGLNGFSTFYGYYMLEALAQNGKYDEALDFISKYWGAMLDLGATTFWEDLKYSDVVNAGRIDEIVPESNYDIHSGGGAYCYKGLRLSLCHGWASGPTSWLTKHVLGVTPVEPGCRTLRIKPNLGSLKSVKGTFPTPYGVVSISCTKNDKGKVVSEVKAPDKVKIVMD